MHTDVRVLRGFMIRNYPRVLRQTILSPAHLSVLAEMATIPSGHCSEEKLDAYSNVSYDSGVRWNLDWYE